MAASAGRNLVFARDVADDGGDALGVGPGIGGQLGGCGVEPAMVEVGQQHAVAVPQQAARGGEADAAGGAGDDGGLSGWIGCHGASIGARGASRRAMPTNVMVALYWGGRRIQGLRLCKVGQHADVPYPMLPYNPFQYRSPRKGNNNG
jgi:hypothetical protein